MTQSNINTDKTRGARRASRIVIGVILAIILGTVGSGLWDLLFKPGIGTCGRYITGISSYIDNAVFTSAALDPLPLSSLIIILLLATTPLLGALYFVFLGFIKIPFEVLMHRKLACSNETTEAHIRRLRKWLRLTAMLGVLLSVLVFSAGYTAFAVLNEAVLVWRTFNKNIDICAPFMSAEQHSSALASFRSMSTRTDFDNVKSTLNDLATQHSIVLKWYDTH